MGFENGKLVQVRLRASDGPAHEYVSVLHYDLQDDPIPGNDPNDPQLLADAFAGAVVTAWKPMVPTTWTIDPIVVTMAKDPQNPTAPLDQWTSGSPVAGTRSLTGNDFLPYGVTAVATLRTNHVGKRYRGRIFLPCPLLEGDQNADIIVAGTMTALNAFLNSIPHQPDIVAGASGSKALWCVYSRTNRAADLDPYASAIQSTQLRSTLKFLRSRSTGH